MAEVAPEVADTIIGIARELGVEAQIVGSVAALADNHAPAQLDVTGADGKTYRYAR